MIRTRLTYGNVVATLALFFALGGGAYAVNGVARAGGIFHGCVGKRSGSLRIVRSAKACHRRGRAAEYAIQWNQRGPSGPPGRDGNDGARGPAGPTGQTGAPGKDAAKNIVVRAQSYSVTANCNPGEKAVGGGGVPDSGASIVASYPQPTSGTPTGWRVAQSGGFFQPTTYVVCASP